MILLPTEPFAPRPYQLAAQAAAHEAWEETPGAMLVMATGTGKTATALHIAVEGFLAQGKRVVWLAHREELLTQPHTTLGRWWPELLDRAGIVQAQRDRPDAQIVFASVATLANTVRLSTVIEGGHPDLLVVDECHHSTSPQQKAVIAALTAPHTRLLGLTATPDREDGGDLSEMWRVAFSYGMLAAIRDEALLPPYASVAMLPDLDLGQITGRRDYDDAELGAALLKAHVVEHTVAAMGRTHQAQRLPRRNDTRELSAKGRSTLVFTATVEQARLTAEALSAAGWVARCLSGATPTSERRRLLRAFAAGQIEVLCNAAVLTEGTDLPRCSCVVLARPTRSWSLFCQIVGRGMRPHPGDTECLVIDLAGATSDHSLVSAPALIGGTRCAASPSGAHDYRRAVEGKAVCEHCEHSLPCWAALQVGKAGQHDFVDGRCRHCAKIQCPDAPDRLHHWIRRGGHKRQCMYCGHEIPDQGLKPGETRDAERIDAAWLPLPQLTPPTEVCDLGEHGLVYLLTDTDGVRPVWLPARGRKGRPLTDGPTDRWHAEEVASDLLRRARRGWDPWSKQKVPGGQGNATEGARLRQRATLRATRTGVASWR